MDEYKSIFLSLDPENSGQIDIGQLKESVEKNQENEFRSFMSDELDVIKTNTIDSTTYNGWYFMFIKITYMHKCFCHLNYCTDHTSKV